MVEPADTLFAEERTIYSVSEITFALKSILESQFADVWIMGEISNFKAHSSGHYYFSLKDDKATLGAAMFRGANRKLKFKLEDGLQVLACGRISLYEPQGKYQLIVDHLEPQGVGSLQLAFEQLKAKLSAEGLFDEARKRPLPAIIKTVGVVTSPTGAVIRDIIHILRRRDPLLKIVVAPTRVQGEGAEVEIVSAMQLLQDYGACDVLLLARGGGSMEDLWPFNTELLVRAVAHANISVVSAVGHETDFTLCDFAADLRAPTPSAAAEIISQDLNARLEYLNETNQRLYRAMLALLDQQKQLLLFFQKRLRDPRSTLLVIQQRLDEASERVQKAMLRYLQTQFNLANHYSEKLHLLSPLAVLTRGYSLTYLLTEDKNKKLIHHAQDLKVGDLVEMQFQDGSRTAKIK